jgi:hypothetical protein
MGFLDRFRRAPAKTARSDSGRGHVGGYLRLEEMNTELQGIRGLQVFDLMYRSDPDVRRVVMMMLNPLVNATWVLEPAGGEDAEEKDKQAAELVRWALFDRMRPSLPDHLAEFLPVLIRSGFAPGEQVWGLEQWHPREGSAREVLVPRKIDLRLPRTIQRWIQDDRTNELIAIEQWTTRGGRVQLPIDDIVYYRIGAEGDNWEGTSMLRPIYKPWFLKDKIERIDAIAQEREAIGVPIGYPPENVNDDELDAVEEILANVRTNEQGYILAPGPHADNSEKGRGWRFEILSHKSSEQRSAEPSLKYHTGKIEGGFIAEFMRLGQDGVGARATAEVQQDPFTAAFEALGNIIAGVLNDSIVNRIVALNLDVEEPPKLKLSSVDATSLEELASYVSTLVEKGAIHADDELEDFLRKRGKLPPADARAREERKKRAEQVPPGPGGDDDPPDPKKPEPDPKPKPGDPPAPKKDPSPAPKDPGSREITDPHRWSRELRWWEKHMELELIDSTISNARTRLEAAAGDPSRELARTYAAAALKGTAVMPKPGPEVEEAIAGELGALYKTGRATVIRELDRQRTTPAGATPPSSIEDDALEDLLRRAKLAAASIAARIWQAVSRAALARPGDVAAIQAAGETEAAAALRAEAQLHAAGSLNAGREDQAQAQAEEVRGSRYTSILDGHRCDPCRSADDDVLRALDDPVRVARKPPNPQCEGGGKCRCLEFYELKAEEPGYGGPQPPAPPTDPVPTSPGAGSHFDITGGTAELRAQVAEQISAIEQVHKMPASMPRIPMIISAMRRSYGLFTVWRSALTNQGTTAEIRVSRAALERDPSITSVVHEIGHFLDAFGLGSDVPGGIANRAYLSTKQPLEAWRQAVTSSNAYRQLVLGGGSAYVTSTRELWARSYEQWIALRSGNARLAAKIEARRQEETTHLYWEDDDFAPIAAAFDEAFASRGLR